MSKFTAQGKFREVQGMFTSPINAGLRMIVQFVGLNGKYETEQEQKIAKIWKGAESDYKRWFALQQKFELGAFQETAVASDIWIIHLLVKDKNNKLDEKALEKGVKKLAEFAKFEHGSLHFAQNLLDEAPKFKEYLDKYAISEGINVYAYTVPEHLNPR